MNYTADNTKRGTAILELIAYNFKEQGRAAKASFAALFHKDAPTIWPWYGGKRPGIPASRRDHFEALVESGELKLPPGRTVSDYVNERPPSRYARGASEQQKNEDLATLFYAIVRHPELGPATLETLMKARSFQSRLLTPSHFLKWAYIDGGVPASYQYQFANALVQVGIARVLLGYNPSEAGADEAYELKLRSLSAEVRQTPESKDTPKSAKRKGTAMNVQQEDLVFRSSEEEEDEEFWKAQQPSKKN